MDINIKTATVEDVKTISQLISMSCLTNITLPPQDQTDIWYKWVTGLDTINKRLETSNCITLIATHKTKPIGTGYINLGDERAYIGGLYIHPDYQQQGVGYKILKHLTSLTTDKHKIVEAEISHENIPSKKLFTKAGFQYSGELPSRFFNPSIWELWTLHLNN